MAISSGWDEGEWNQCQRFHHKCVTPSNYVRLWNMLDGDTQTQASVLGWFEQSWNHKSPKPTSHYTKFCYLTKDEQLAAMHIGFTSITWDCFVVRSLSPTSSPTISPAPPCRVGTDLVINEASSVPPVFVELLNVGQTRCSLDGAQLSLSRGLGQNAAAFPRGITLEANGMWLGYANANEVTAAAKSSPDISVSLLPFSSLLAKDTIQLCQSNHTSGCESVEVLGVSIGRPCDSETFPCQMARTPGRENGACVGANSCPSKSKGDQKGSNRVEQGGCFGLDESACTSVLVAIYGCIVIGYIVGRKVDKHVEKSIKMKAMRVRSTEKTIGTEYAFISIVFLNIMDALMDAMVLTDELSKDERLLYHYYASIASLCVSAVVNCIVVMVFLNHVLATNAHFFTWFRNNTATTSGFTVLSFLNASNIQIISSKIFNADAFSAPLSAQAQQTMRVFGIVSNVLEDLPQIAIILHANSITGNWGTTAILCIVGSIMALCFGIIRRSFEALVRRHSSKHALVVPAVVQQQGRRRSTSKMMTMLNTLGRSLGGESGKIQISEERDLPGAHAEGAAETQG